MDTTMASRGSMDHRHLSRRSNSENELLFISDICHRSELMCVFEADPEKSTQGDGLSRNPCGGILNWGSPLSSQFAFAQAGAFHGVILCLSCCARVELKCPLFHVYIPLPSQLLSPHSSVQR